VSSECRQVTDFQKRNCLDKLSLIHVQLDGTDPSISGYYTADKGIT
jgi:hypothetical protein